MPAKKRSKIDRHLGEATRKSIWRHPLLSHSVLSLVIFGREAEEKNLYRIECQIAIPARHETRHRSRCRRRGPDKNAGAPPIYAAKTKECERRL